MFERAPKSTTDLLTRVATSWSLNKWASREVYICSATPQELVGFIYCGQVKIDHNGKRGEFFLFRDKKPPKEDLAYKVLEVGTPAIGFVERPSFYHFQAAILSLTGLPDKDIKTTLKVTQKEINSWTKAPGELIPTKVLRPLLKTYLTDNKPKIQK